MRNVCPVGVKNLDDLAKGKGLSRQAFLKEKPETLSIVEEEAERGQAIDNLYNWTMKAMENCSGPITNLKCISHKITGEDEGYWQQANTEEWFP